MEQAEAVTMMSMYASRDLCGVVLAEGCWYL